MKGHGVWYGLLGSVLILACSENKQEAGRPGVDETSNGLTAQVFTTQGEPAIAVDVKQVGCEFSATTNATMLTDDHGRVFLDTANWGGELCLEVRGTGSAARMHYRVGDSTRLDSIVLKPTGCLEGHVDLPPHITHAYIEIYGIAGRLKTKRGGDFLWEDLPAGEMQMRAVLIDTPVVLAEARVDVISDSVAIPMFELPVADTASWKYAVSVVLNTGAKGAALTETLLAFPVLVHMDGAQFPDGASAQGADLRFFSRSGVALPYEIVKWDSIGKHAQVWLLLDTLQKNDAKQTVTMRWGNPLAVAPANAKMVFDSANAWVGGMAFGEFLPG